MLFPSSLGHRHKVYIQDSRIRIMYANNKGERASFHIHCLECMICIVYIYEFKASRLSWFFFCCTGILEYPTFLGFTLLETPKIYFLMTNLIRGHGIWKIPN